MLSTNLVNIWLLAAEDLGLDIITPAKITLSNGSEINASFLLKNFGASKGMLIANDYNIIKKHIKTIHADGYGFSIFREPEDGAIYIRSAIIDVLRDWGWSNKEKQAPAWL